MIFHPAVMALFAASIVVGFMVLYSSWFAVWILAKWDLGSGSEQQLALERKTYLISTLLAYVFAFEILSFFLYIFTVDRLHVFFTGAMCAAGSLNVNAYGYPALVVKLIIFLLAGVWLVVNYVDNSGYDYPLIRKKYVFFLLLAPLVMLEAGLQANYFFRLDPEIITSCCGTLFSTGEGTLFSELRFLTHIPLKTVFYVVTPATVGMGFFFYAKGRGGYLFSTFSAVTLAVSVASFFSFISAYIYELPTHHCPFCMLQKEYGYVGYPLYLTLFGSTICGISVGVLTPFCRIESLSNQLPPFLRKLAVISAVLLLVFVSIVTACIFFSNLFVEG